ncbi:MAG: hypothetical protein H0T79_03500 [Deltaproteobacteria bacterium]|nr:hypothetical protein [Deltaproteobacteria bacterium]
MSVRRLISLLSLSLLTAGVAAAQPRKAPAPTPAPAPAAPPAEPAGSGEPVAPIEDPPADINGTDENPDAPKNGDGDALKVVAAPEKQKTSGYPIEEALRPITLFQNMSEVSIAPHAQMKPYEGTSALRARYGITRQVQLGLTYVLGGIHGEPRGGGMVGDIGFHPGKAVGLDVTVLLQNWVGVKVGVPVYIDPLAVSITLGAPMRFRLTDQLTIGGLDDVLNIAVKEFAPSYYSEASNARQAAEITDMTNTVASSGTFRLAGYGIFQYQTKLAIVGSLGITVEDFAGNIPNGGGVTTQIRGGIQYSPRRFLDLGVSIGWDDLATLETFAPAGYLAIRI